MGDESTPASPENWTVGRLLTWTHEHFTRCNVDEPRLAAEILLAHAMACERIRLYTRFDESPAEKELAVFRDSVRKAAKHAPIAYLVGHKEFYSLDFDVAPGVLIPRPETETLAEQAIAFGRGREAEICFLDLGTGSGCVAITVLKHLPKSSCVATDRSSAALEIARANAEKHGMADRVRFVEADMLALPADCLPDGGFDLIVSNPPYIPEAEWATLDANVRDFEPKDALTPGEDGLDFYRAITAGAPGMLAEDGCVLVEIGAGQGEAVVGVFCAERAFEHVGTHSAPNDPHERVLQFAKLC